MDLEKIETPTAKPGWISRILGMVEEMLTPTQERLEPMPAPPEILLAQTDSKLQLEGDGFGKLLGRVYEVRFKTSMTPEQLMQQVKRNLASLGPEEIANFEKSKGIPWRMSLGDEYHIRLLGPWNGQVRVIEVGEDCFSFVTLEGHPEAGRIRFHAGYESDQQVVLFSVMSWARARDALIDVSYDKLGIAKNLQATTWRTFLNRVVELAEGEALAEPVVSECVLEADKPS
jgi:hypothetical protein